MNSSHIPVGSLVRETYTIDSHIASGAFSDVYRVRHRFMGMQAMKVLRDTRSEEQRAHGLFEAFQLSKISHPAIVRVFDGNYLNPEHGGHAYVTMELIEGGTLSDLGQAGSRTFASDVLAAASQLAGALAHAHGLTPALVHRDIKPSNVLMNRRDDGVLEVRLADFGLAVPIDPLLGFAAAGGTIVYRAPESFDGFETQTSDVYSFGLTLYEAATGVFPFYEAMRQHVPGSQAEFIETLRVAQQGVIAPPSYFRQAIHPVIDLVIMRCLVFDRAMRIQDGGALCEAVAAMRLAVSGDDETPAEVRDSLTLAHDPAKTQEALDALVKALRDSPRIGPAYVPLIAFLRTEWRRIKSQGIAL